MNFIDVMASYGGETGCIALATIMLIGIIKLAFKKRLKAAGSAVAKSIYESLTVIFAFGLTALWLFLAMGPMHLREGTYGWDVVLSEGALAYTVTKVIYPLYENFHIRDFIQLIGKVIVEAAERSAEKAKAKKVEADAKVEVEEPVELYIEGDALPVKKETKSYRK